MSLNILEYHDNVEYQMKVIMLSTTFMINGTCNLVEQVSSIEQRSMSYNCVVIHNNRT